MNSKQLEDFINSENLKNLSSFILKLTPFEFVSVGTIIGYLLSYNLTVSEQNSLGNWFELVGQIILTFNAQGSINLPPSPKQYTDLEKKVEELECILKKYYPFK